MVAMDKFASSSKAGNPDALKSAFSATADA